MELESPRRRSSSSPEFEFWMIGNSYPELEPNLHTADELFIDGVLQPLYLLSIHKNETNFIEPDAPVASASSAPGPTPPASESSIFCSTPLTTSKRWKDIFKKKEPTTEGKEKKKEKERKTSSSSNGAAELNINIWPFSRSRSAGRPKATAAAMRKSSSAPCSRSNSRGENAGTGGRRWAPSPGRPGVGVPVGRASPVWQARRVAKGPAGLKYKGKSGVNLNVNSCIGYGSQVSCRGEGGGGSGGLFKFRGLFSKKVY